MTHVFISYARKDGLTHADRLAAELQQAGYEPWVDRRHIDPTRDFTGYIDAAIEQASHVVVCITPDAKRPDSYVRREVGFALAQNPPKPVYVARFAETAPFSSIVNNTWLEFWKGWKSAFDHLLTMLKTPAEQYKRPELPADLNHPLRPYVERLYESAYKHLETAIIRLIDLDITESPDAVPTRSQQIDDIALLFEDTRTRQPFTSFEEAFKSFNRRALLLGEPGGGKTVTLMATARQAAADWLNGPDHNPLPILALISTWDSIQQPPLIDWLGSKKDLSPEPVREVMTAGRALLLLDGLDELGAERTEKKADNIEERYDPRQRFIIALNAGLGENAALVTCREEEYKAIGQQAVLDGAVTLRQLTDGQIRDYLSADPGLGLLQAAIDADDGLRQMSRTPLLLSYLAFGFRDRPEALRDLKDLSEGDLRDAVFMSYMDKRYDRELKRLAKMGQEPPFTLEFIKEVLGRVAMEDACDKQSAINLLEYESFVNVLPRGRINSFINFCLLLNYLNRRNEEVGFVHLKLRDTLAFQYSMPRLHDLPHYQARYWRNPAVALGNIRDKRATQPLIDLFDNAGPFKDWNEEYLFRDSAIMGLARIGDTRAVARLISALTDETYPNGIYRIIDCLGVSGDRRAVEPLLRFIDLSVVENICQTMSGSDFERAYWTYVNFAGIAMLALGAIGDHRAVEPIIMLLSSEYSSTGYLISKASSALAVLRDRRAVESLIKLLDNKKQSGHIYYHRNCDVAAYALEQIGTPEAVAAVAEWRARGGDKG